MYSRISADGLDPSSSINICVWNLYVGEWMSMPTPAVSFWFGLVFSTRKDLLTILLDALNAQSGHSGISVLG